MATAGDQIDRALRLLGVLAEGETPSAATYTDCLEAFNQMLDSWSTERLAVYTTQTQAFTWPASQATRTLGPSGNFVGTRPILIDPSTYYVYDGVSYTLSLINQQQYNDIPTKTATSTLPTLMYVNMSHPNLTMTLYPVPSADLAFKIVSVTPLSEPATTGTTLAFPPGYLRAFVYNLACEIAPEFGVPVPSDVRNIARQSKRDLRRINDPGKEMGFPVAVLPNRGYGNPYTGWFL